MTAAMQQREGSSQARAPFEGRSERLLIVNADDFGMSDSVNGGIVDSHSNGVVTSASLLVRRPAARSAVRRSADYPALSLGLHVDLGEWTFQHDTWKCLYDVVPLDNRAAVEGEVARQLEMFRNLTGREPTHLDSHQHVHRHEPVKSVLVELAGRLAVPLRHFSRHVTYCGEFYGQTGKGDPCPEAITVGRLLEIISTLPLGLTELACHPGHPEPCVPEGAMYCQERSRELATLCDPAIRNAIVAQSIELCSFADLRCQSISTRGLS